MKESSCIINRPGGFEITDKAISFCSFQKGAKLLDLGCGSGATINYLSETYGFEAYGIDPNLDPDNKSTNLLRGSSEDIPFPPASMDGIIMECSFSLMKCRETVLKECRRVLKTSGKLIISDMYARGEPATLKGCLGEIDTKDNILLLLENNGFIIKLFQDYSASLVQMWGQMILENGAGIFYNSIGIDTEKFRKIKCGYFLTIAVKKGQSL